MDFSYTIRWFPILYMICCLWSFVSATYVWRWETFFFFFFFNFLLHRFLLSGSCISRTLFYQAFRFCSSFSFFFFFIFLFPFSFVFFVLSHNTYVMRSSLCTYRKKSSIGMVNLWCDTIWYCCLCGTLLLRLLLVALLSLFAAAALLYDTVGLIKPRHNVLC